MTLWSLFGFVSAAITSCLGAHYNDMSLLDFQFRGTHNSYRKIPSRFAPMLVYDYTDYSLTYQLNNGVRAFELDVQSCDNGNQRNNITGVCDDWTIQHIVTFDDESTCETVTECIDLIAAWSYQYRGYHLPLFVKVELKDPGLGSNWANYSDIIQLASVIDDIFIDYYSESGCNGSDVNPILSYTDDYMYKFNSSWYNTTLSEMRGKVLVFLTTGSSEHVLDISGSGGQNWPDDISDVFFGSCGSSRAFEQYDNDTDWCTIVSQSSNATKVSQISKFNKYIITSNVDTGYIQIEGYTFIFENSNDTIPTYINITVNDSYTETLVDFNTWQYEQFFDCLNQGRINDTANTTDTDDCLDFPRLDYYDDLLYSCEVFEWLYYVQDEATAAFVYSYLVSLALNPITSVTVFEGALQTLGYEENLEGLYIRDDIESNSISFINGGSNILATDFPYGTDDVINPWQFSVTLTCNNSSMYDINEPARIKNGCLMFEDGGDTDDSMDSCVYGETIDQFEDNTTTTTETPTTTTTSPTATGSTSSTSPSDSNTDTDSDDAIGLKDSKRYYIGVVFCLLIAAMIDY